MDILFFMVFGIAVIGGDFVKLNIAGISFTYITMIALFISYFRYFIIKRAIISLDTRSKALLLFEIYAFFMIVISALQYNKLFISEELYTNIYYIPRQAYYLSILPALILMRDNRNMERLQMFLNKYANFLFWIIVLLHIIYTRSLSISVPTVVILSFLALYSGKNRLTLSNITKLIVIVFTPIAVGGEMTNFIIRCVYILLFVSKQEKTNIKILRYIFIGMLLCIFLLPIFIPIFQFIFDANSFWRLAYWQDELGQLIKSNMLGVGYGTSYATQQFVGNNLIGGPFAASGEYSTMDKLFITGPHCSYVAVAFRTGIIGIGLFLYFIFSIISAIVKYINDIPIHSIFLFFSSLFLIGVNVGLESPYYLMVFVFSTGVCIYNINLLETKENYEKINN